MKNYKIGDEVILVQEGNMDKEDFGAYGIVLESPLKKFIYRLNDIFYYAGTMKENEDWCIISTSPHRDGTDFLIHKQLIKSYE